MLVTCSVTDILSTPTIMEQQGSFHSSQINACIVGIGVLGTQFIVSSEGLGLHILLPLRGIQTQHLQHVRQAPYPLVMAKAPYG